MVAIFEQLWEWAISWLKIFILLFFAGVERLLPTPPDLSPYLDAVQPFLLTLNRFFAIDWLFYYLLIYLSIQGLVLLLRAVTWAWQQMPFT